MRLKFLRLCILTIFRNAGLLTFWSVLAEHQNIDLKPVLTANIENVQILVKTWIKNFIEVFETQKVAHENQVFRLNFCTKLRRREKIFLLRLYFPTRSRKGVKEFS